MFVIVQSTISGFFLFHVGRIEDAAANGRPIFFGRSILPTGNHLIGLYMWGSKMLPHLARTIFPFRVRIRVQMVLTLPARMVGRRTVFSGRWCARPSLSTSSLSMGIKRCVGGRSCYVIRANDSFLGAAMSLLRGSLSPLALFVKRSRGCFLHLGFHILPGWHVIATYVYEDQRSYIVGHRVS